MGDATVALEGGTRLAGPSIGIADGVPIPSFMKAVDEIELSGLQATTPSPPGQFVDDFSVDKQDDNDLCWAAVTVSAARYRNEGAWTQDGLVTRYHNSNAYSCPCTARPGDGGLNLWCVDCAFAMIGLAYWQYSETPRFSSLGQTMASKNPVCLLLTGVPYNHYVVAVGTFVNALGQQMVRITDPDPGQPQFYDVEYKSLVTGSEAVLEWYQF